MERRALGSSGLEVPVVGMGTSRTLDVRGRAAEATSRRIVEEALDAGAGLFESSPMYGEAGGGEREPTSRRIVEGAVDGGAGLFDSSPMYGEAERVLGLALDGRRDEAIVATKVWTANDAEAERQIGASLRHAHGHIELYQVHNLISWPARLDRLERLRDDGLVDVLGATHYG